MTRRTRMAHKLSHPSRRRTAWQQVKRGKAGVSEWRYRLWEYRTGRIGRG